VCSLGLQVDVFTLPKISKNLLDVKFRLFTKWARRTSRNDWNNTRLLGHKPFRWACIFFNSMFFIQLNVEFRRFKSLKHVFYMHQDCYEMRYMNSQQSWIILCRKTNRIQDMIQGYSHINLNRRLVVNNRPSCFIIITEQSTFNAMFVRSDSSRLPRCNDVHVLCETKTIKTMKLLRLCCSISINDDMLTAIINHPRFSSTQIVSFF
jgi:hypothetical protein